MTTEIASSAAAYTNDTERGVAPWQTGNHLPRTCMNSHSSTGRIRADLKPVTNTLPINTMANEISELKRTVELLRNEVTRLSGRLRLHSGDTYWLTEYGKTRRRFESCSTNMDTTWTSVCMRRQVTNRQCYKLPLIV